MNKAYFQSLMFAVLAGLALVGQAAQADKVEVSPGMTHAAEKAEAPAQTQQVTVNINSADAATLVRELSGIGEAKAQAIIEHRETVGPFASVDELLEVKGIGAATLEKNRSKLSVD
ncbi:MAG: helix-hairpin-helix domain-containing protein [Pseudomonadota bacterium]